MIGKSLLSILMKMFKYYLEGNAREWCRSLPAPSIFSLIFSCNI
jgi:hypothetical protein